MHSISRAQQQSDAAHALHKAAARGDADAIRRLLKDHPGLLGSASRPNFTTPLHRAAAGGHQQAAAVLVHALPAAALMPDERSLLPLHRAISGQHAAVVGLLLDAAPASAEWLHAFPNSCCRNSAPLHWAAQHASVAVVRLLLEAAPQAAALANGHSHVPMHIVVFGGRAGWEIESHNARAPWHLFVEMARLLLATGSAGLLQRDWAGDTPLHNAALAGSPPELVRLVASAEPAAAEVRNRQGRLPLACSLAKASAYYRWDEEQGEAYLRCAGALLEFGATDGLLEALCEAGEVALPLFARLAASRPLTAEQWARVPRGAPGLGAVLPAVLARSPSEAPLLTRRLFRRDRRRLWEYLRCLARVQRDSGVALPPHVVWHTLSFV